MRRTSLILLAWLPACAARTPAAPPAPGLAQASTTPPGPACAEPERRAMDFWIGDWDLSVEVPADAGAQSWTRARGVSVIRPVLGGCAIEESFHADGPDAPWAGRSFSMYVPAQRAWRQTWVDDSGSYLAFDGGPTPGGFTLMGEEKSVAGRRTRMRMVFREITRDAIVWSWERGTEPPAAWTPAMVIRYTRRPAADEAASCEAAAPYHDLDFWVGDWRVLSGGKEVGTNHIAKSLAGCAVVEEWKDADGSEGRSLFFHPPSSSSWKQVWITGAATRLGGAKEKELVSRGPDGALRFQGELPLPSGRTLLDRTTLTPLAGGNVHQVIEVSRDMGAHWEARFDAIYERR